jgi:hypothetical protein
MALKILNRYLLLIILLVELICASNVKWGGNRWKEILAFDGKGYYAYLPAVFIYKDLGFSFHDKIEEQYASVNTKYEYRVTTPTGVVNKYFVGTALAELPFFLVAHLITNLTGNTSNGYSFIYQLSISLAALFYGLLGLIMLGKLLRLYGISENIVSFSTIVIVFGTNLFYYTVFEPSTSHAFSFGLITTFLFVLKRLIRSKRKNDIVLSGILLGLIVLIRPVNFVVVFILPFLCGNFSSFKLSIQFILSQRIRLSLALLFFLIIVSIQGFFYFLQTGFFFVDSYIVEHFIWNRLEIVNFLFSYKKGFFIYTPAALVTLIVYIFLNRRNLFQVGTFLLFFLLISYVFSSWWNWWYGGSFGARPLTEYLALFGLLLAISLSKIKSKLTSNIFYSLLTSCIILCQVQTYQYRYFIIHWEKMDNEHYWRVFMRIDQLVKKENANKDLIIEVSNE